MTFSTINLQKYLPKLCAGTWWIALSGGLDSCVLLHAIAVLKLPVKLHALHINHQISPFANQWQEHCAALCERLNIAFTAVKVDVINTGKGIEDAAREARYKVFEEHLQLGDYLLTAHHADDQAETLLLRLMRGTGPRGLAAMAQSRTLGQGTLYRPLLHFTRAQLEGYAHENQLVWVNDESNASDHYDRNYLRNQVMPLLRERWPQFAQKWQQTADLCAANENLIEELAKQDFILAAYRSEFIGTSLSLDYLQNLSQTRRQNLLRYWLRNERLSIPEQQHFIQIEDQIIAGRQDAETQVNWGDLSLRVYRDRVFALPLVELLAISTSISVPLNLTLNSSVLLPTGKTLKFEHRSISQSSLLRSDLPDITVRFRQGGERCKPVGRSHSQTLKKLLQNYNIAPWLRETLPLIYSGSELVAVADLWVCEGYQSENSGYKIIHLA